MPQMNKGGKFIFGKSVIGENGAVQIPPQAIQEYRITRRGLVEPSKLGHILTENPDLLRYASACGAFIRYKGRSYCWTNISNEGAIMLSESMMDFLEISPGDELLSIRSSDIAFTMGARGPLLERAKNYGGDIPIF